MPYITIKFREIKFYLANDLLFGKFLCFHFKYRALDFPAKTLAMVLLIKTGRRWPYIICMACGGIGFLMMTAFERGKYTNDWVNIQKNKIDSERKL